MASGSRSCAALAGKFCDSIASRVAAKPAAGSRSLSHQHLQAQETLRPSLSWGELVARTEPAGASEPAWHTRWVFLGAPGVGKGTYASRLGKYLGVAHISMGDLVRDELRNGTQLADEMRAITSKGQLLSDRLVLELLERRLRAGAETGERGFILDGFPRNTFQAEALDSVTPIDKVVNLSLREDVLLTKLLGRRMCGDCGGNFNVADIYIDASDSKPAIVMPPLPPPTSCASKMTVRADDTEEVVRSRLEIYYRESKPVEDFYRSRGQLVEFEVTGGIPETWPRLLQALGVDGEEEDDDEDQQVA